MFIIIIIIKIWFPGPFSCETRCPHLKNCVLRISKNSIIRTLHGHQHGITLFITKLIIFILQNNKKNIFKNERVCRDIIISKPKKHRNKIPCYVEMRWARGARGCGPPIRGQGGDLVPYII